MGVYRENLNLIKKDGRKKWYESQKRGKKIIKKLYPKESVFHIDLVKRETAKKIAKQSRLTIIYPYQSHKGGQWSVRIATYRKAFNRLARELNLERI